MIKYRSRIDSLTNFITKRCALLDPHLDVALSCNRGGHEFSLARRHDLWVRVWGAFLRAHGWTVAWEPRRQCQCHHPGCKVPDLMARGPTGALHLLDCTIRHTCPPGRGAFGVHATRVRQFERDKRAEYEAGWPQQLEVPQVVPLAASTFASVGEAAQGFFRQVVRGRAGGAPVASDALRFQNLASGQVTELWRRRISVFLRIAIGLQVLSRVRVAALGPGLTQGGDDDRGMGWARGEQQRQLFGALQRRRSTAREARDAERGVGGAYGGDVAGFGVLGSSVLQSRPAERRRRLPPALRWLGARAWGPVAWPCGAPGVRPALGVGVFGAPGVPCVSPVLSAFPPPLRRGLE